MSVKTSKTTDPPTDPGLAAPVGAEQAESSEAAYPDPDQRNRRIGEAGEIPLPDAVDIVDPAHSSRFLRWVNESWIQFQNVMIGLYAFFVEWYVSLAKLFMKFPWIGGLVSVVAIIFLEERFSEHPYISNFVKYYYYKNDPEAAAMIFAEREVDPDPIGTGIKKTIEKATEEYMTSPAYRELQEEVALYQQYQFQRGTYISSGMTEELAELDAEMAVLRAERRAKKEAKAEGTSTTEVTYSPVIADPAPKQGRSIEAVPTEEESPVMPDDAQLQPEDETSETVPGDEGVEKAKAERRKGDKQGKVGDEIVDRARKEAEKLLPPLPN